MWTLRNFFFEMDGNFPNHHPDPTIKKNLDHLKAKMTEDPSRTRDRLRRRRGTPSAGRWMRKANVVCRVTTFF